MILFEKRGLGASDRSSDWAPLEERMNDLKGHVEYEARDHAFWIHPDPVGAALQEFLTGTPVEPEPDRVLAAVRGVPGEWRLLALRSDDSNARLS